MDERSHSRAWTRSERTATTANRLVRESPLRDPAHLLTQPLGQALIPDHRDAVLWELITSARPRSARQTRHDDHEPPGEAGLGPSALSDKDRRRCFYTGVTRLRRRGSPSQSRTDNDYDRDSSRHLLHSRAPAGADRIHTE